MTILWFLWRVRFIYASVLSPVCWSSHPPATLSIAFAHCRGRTTKLKTRQDMTKQDKIREIWPGIWLSRSRCDEKIRTKKTAINMQKERGSRTTFLIFLKRKCTDSWSIYDCYGLSMTVMVFLWISWSIYEYHGLSVTWSFYEYPVLCMTWSIYDYHGLSMTWSFYD